jgi:hypothetical protein
MIYLSIQKMDIKYSERIVMHFRMLPVSEFDILSFSPSIFDI